MTDRPSLYESPIPGYAEGSFTWDGDTPLAEVVSYWIDVDCKPIDLWPGFPAEVRSAVCRMIEADMRQRAEDASRERPARRRTA